MKLRDFRTFLEGIRSLRGEELALETILVRAAKDPSASEPIVREHRLGLDRVRAQLNQKRSAASSVLELLVRQINELRFKALEVRGNIEELRDHAELGGAVAKLTEFSAELQRNYRNLFDQISRHETELRDLQVELHQLDQPKTDGAAPQPTLPPALNVLDPPASISDPLDVRGATSRSHVPAKGLDRSTLPGVRITPHTTATSAPRRGSLRPTTIPARLPKPDRETAPAVPESARPARAASRDRKTEPRYPYQAPVRVRIEGRSLLARSGDISRSGLFLEGQPTLPVGTAVTLGLAFQDFPLELSGEVVYETPGVGMGLRFTASSDIDARHLDDLLAHLGRLSAEAGHPASSRGGARGDRKPRSRTARSR